MLVSRREHSSSHVILCQSMSSSFFKSSISSLSFFLSSFLNWKCRSCLISSWETQLFNKYREENSHQNNCGASLISSWIEWNDSARMWSEYVKMNRPLVIWEVVIYHWYQWSLSPLCPARCSMVNEKFECLMRLNYIYTVNDDKLERVNQIMTKLSGHFVGHLREWNNWGYQ